MSFSIDYDAVKIAYPELHEQAEETAPFSFFLIPKKFRKTLLQLSPEGELDLSYMVKIEKIMSRISSSEVFVKTSRLSADFREEPCIQKVINKLVHEEKDRFVSEECKKTLLEIFLRYLFTNEAALSLEARSASSKTFFPFTNPDLPEGKQKAARKTVWYHVFGRLGNHWLQQLKDLGLIKEFSWEADLNDNDQGTYVYWWGANHAT